MVTALAFGVSAPVEEEDTPMLRVHNQHGGNAAMQHLHGFFQPLKLTNASLCREFRFCGGANPPAMT